MIPIDKLSPPDSTLFFKSHDSNDIRMGQIVTHLKAEYANSKIVILGCPQDEGVKRNNGRPGAAEAPDKIRQCFYKLSAPEWLKRGLLFDVGNTIIGQTLEKTHENQYNIVSEFLKDGKTIIILGGGNDISYPDCKALADQYKNVLALNIDSHFDVRENALRNSGTPYRQLLEEKIINPKLFCELSFQPFANSEIYQKYLNKMKVTTVTLDHFREKGIQKTVKSILRTKKSPAIFWGIDIDSVRSADAPGVSASYPTGLTAEELLSIASLAGTYKRSKLLEISEVNPAFDIDDRTSKLAALIMYNFLKGIAK